MFLNTIKQLMRVKRLVWNTAEFQNKISKCVYTYLNFFAIM
jgi:hypothetical protein